MRQLGVRNCRSSEPMRRYTGSSDVMRVRIKRRKFRPTPDPMIVAFAAATVIATRARTSAAATTTVTISSTTMRI